MSTQVALAALADTVTAYDFAYLITIGDQGHSHVVAVSPLVHAESITVAKPGRRSRANTEQNTQVTLVWPPPEPAGYSLIVDGIAHHGAEHLIITPERAVLHRPAPPSSEQPGGAGCGSDCIELPTS